MKPKFLYLLFVCITWLAPQIKAQDADALFNKGDFRQALLAYHQQFCTESQTQQLTTLEPDSFVSSEIEAEDHTILKAHCLFTKGAIAFIKHDKETALRQWVACRDTLQNGPDKGKTYLRRVNMALAQLWVQSVATKDVKFFHDGLAALCQPIDDNALPEQTADCRNQFKQEYRFLFARTILNTISQLASQNDTVAILTQNLADLWSKKDLYKMLTEDSSEPHSYEAFMDLALFANPESFNVISQKLELVAKAAPPALYPDLAALLCLFQSEGGGNLDQTIAELDASKLDSERFGSVIYLILKTAHNLPHFSSEPLLRGIGRHLNLISWSHPEVRMEMARWLAQAGCAREALGLVLPLQKSLETSPLYPQFGLTLAQVYYFKGDAQAAITATAPFVRDTTRPPAELLYWRGRAYAKLRQKTKAIEAFKTFLAKNPTAEEAPETCFLLGTLCLSNGQRDEAQHYFQQTMVDYKDSIYAERAQQFLGLRKKN